jgi:hypothetical protein
VGGGARPRAARRLALRWRVEALVYALILLASGAVPVVLLRATVDPLGLIDRAPFVVLEAVSLALGVGTAEALMALRRGASGSDDDGGWPMLPFSDGSGGAQSPLARNSIHEHGSHAETLDADRRPPREPAARSRSHE